MAGSTSKSAFWTGFRDGLPFLLLLFPFAMLFGVLAIEAGLNVVEAMAFSVTVIAGAAQFTALSLITEEAPTVIILLSALAVNLRMAMYSATLVPHMGATALWKRAIAAYVTFDQNFAVAINKFDAEPAMTPNEKVAYFIGVATSFVPCWYIFTLVGALVGKAIPEEFALDFAMPILFISLVAPMLKTAAHVAAALTSVAMALALAWVPFNLGLIMAGLAAMMVGAQVELWQERQND